MVRGARGRDVDRVSTRSPSKGVIAMGTVPPREIPNESSPAESEADARTPRPLARDDRRGTRLALVVLLVAAAAVVLVVLL